MLKLKDIMTTDVVTVAPETSLRDAMELLASRHVSGAPIVTGNTLLGVISTTDLLALATSTPGARTQRVENVEWGDCGETQAVDEAIEREDEPGSTFFSDLWADSGADVRERMSMVDSPEWNMLEAHEVSEAMTRTLVTLPSGASVIAAAELMHREHIHRILVVDDGTLVGIVSAMDIATAVAEHKLESRRFVFPRAAAKGGGRRRWP